MRAKQILSRISIPAKVKLVYARLTLNKLTGLYFTVAVVHFLIQVILQLAAHAINVDAQQLVTHILQEARLTMNKFAIVESKRRAPEARGSDVTLTLCRGIPGQFGLTGKDVCDVLWSQSRGLVNHTVEDFLSPSSDSDKNRDSGSGSDSEDEKTKTKTKTDDDRKTKSSLSASTSSTSTITSSNSAASFTAAPSTVPLSIVLTTPSSTSGASTSFTQPTSTSSVFSTSLSQSSGLAAPKGIKQSRTDSPDSDDDELPPVKLLRRRTLKQRRTVVAKKREGEKKVFDREKIRPLSLPPRPRSRAPSQLLAQEASVDIDESHLRLEAHTRRAHTLPITNSLLSRARHGLAVEFIPIAPRAVVDPKRFVSFRSERPSTFKRSKRSTRALASRTLTEQGQQNVTITPVFSFEPEQDDEEKKTEASAGLPSVNSTTSMNSVRAKPKLVSVKISGLASYGLGDTQLLAEAGNNTATFGEVVLSPGCALALSWPAQVLRDFSREDLAIIGFQAWLLGMSVVAILNESVPHLVTGLFTQALSTGWSAFQMSRSASFRDRYETVIVQGACSGVDVLPDYFSHRTKDEIPILVFNGVFLVVTLVLSWRMCKVYGWQTFKRIGASQLMNRVYRLVLAFSIHLQLAVFFFLTSSALWVDQLLNGPVARFAVHAGIYKGVFITSTLLLLPWLVLGWIGVRRENKHMMHAFLVISLLFVTAWSAMFASEVYRWTFATTPFFAAMTVISFVVLVATTGLAIICRYNFKQGLAQFLRSQQILPEAEFTDAMPDPEKVAFPTQRPGGELPTFSVAFGHGGNPQPPSQMFPARPAPVARAATSSDEPSVEYSTNPYSTNSSDFWSNGVTTTRSTSIRSKSSVDTSAQEPVREATADTGVPRYSMDDANPPQPTIRRKLPQWQEVRHSELSHWEDLDLRPQTQIQPPVQADRTSVYSSGTTGTSHVEVLRDDRWQRVDARELHRTSGASGAMNSSGLSGASQAPRDGAGQLFAHVPTTPVPAYRQYALPPPVPRGFGLPGKNVKPYTTGNGHVTQMFPPRAADGLGGAAVPPEW